MWPFWRSAAAGWAALGLVAAAGLPLFLRMPLWIDATLYDLAARNLLAGGVHYRDIFDTNPPGFVWLMCAVRAALGDSREAVRVVDLLIVGAIVVLLLRLARRGGATTAAVAWAAAGCAGFYLYISEFNHAQRDVWMMLPAVAAARLRLSRTRTARHRPVSNRWIFWTAAAEGVVWGAGVWLKPHVFVVAVGVWAAGQGGLAGKRRADFGGVLLGGVAAGLAGVAWLVASGAWEHFVTVMTKWNTSYLANILAELPGRFWVQLGYFPPWSLLALLAVPVAVSNLLDLRAWNANGRAGNRLPAWLYAPAADADAAAARGALAALYLSWLAMALVLQRQFHYAHVPETLLMLAVLAANRWFAVVPVLLGNAGVMAWLALAPGPVPEWAWQGTTFRHLVWEYPDRDPDRLKWWLRCVAGPVTGEVRNGVAFQSDYFSGIDSAGIDDVADYLRSHGVRDGEVLCFNDSPHAVYLALGVRPPIRFMHLSTAVAMGKTQYGWVKDEVEAARPGVRFVVSDLRRWALYYGQADQRRFAEPGPSPADHLPPVLPLDVRDVFPLNQPTVYRSGGGRGRYVVHVWTRPTGELYVPP